ncbi:restriction endonuclease subunit S [Pararhizobium sp. PWRC1-1]|uniref:restriction endonuclease subunit S n=1 Tax=Pararhizobium sp. PWRC1-1 TaxID=2804566 RepID=UPI003CE9B054
MNAERLLQHYEQIADAPNAIARLRRFILDLAVRGKLVPQESADGPALGFDRDLPGTLPRPFDLPRSWMWSRLSSLGSLKGGGTPSKSNNEFWGGNIPWVSPKDMKVDYISASQMTITDKAVRESAVNLIDQGSLLFVVRGMILAHSFPVAINHSVVTINQDMKALTPHNGEMVEYLLRALKGLKPQILAKVQYSSHGTCRLEGSDYSDFLVPLPPLAEQHRIVAQVDELLALCDTLEAARTKRETKRDRLAAASLARLNTPEPETFPDDARFALDALPALTARPDQIKQLRQTILNLAVRGKLVAQDPADEPAEELLRRIAKEKARRVTQGTLREQKPLTSIEDSEIDFELPLGWQWVRMAEVIKLWNGFAFKSGDFQSAGVPVIRIGDLQDGDVTLSRAVRVSETVAKTVGAEVWIPPDALLIAMSGATTGKTAFNKTGTPLLLNQRVGRIEVFLVSVNFLRFFFETIVARNLSISFGTAIPNLSAQQINETIIPLPPLAEQHRIVAKAGELMALCDQLEASLTSADETRKKLLDALLAEALAPVDAEVLQEAAE